MKCCLVNVARFGSVLMLTMTTAVVSAEQPESGISDSLRGTAITSSTPSVIDGLTEVVAGENVLYVDASGRYLVIGSIYDLHEDKDLTAERRAQVSQSRIGPSASKLANRLDQLSDNAAVITGGGDRRLTVIMDPHCGWCRRLWAESLSDLEGVEVRHLFTIPSAEVVGILCAPDPGEALSTALEVSATTTKTPVPTARCRRQATEEIGRVAGLLESAGLSGTPILIRDDGDVHMGYLGRAALLSWLVGSSNDKP